MNFRCNGLDLSEAIARVIKATSSKTTAPILEGIKLRTVGDSLILCATDYEISIQKTIRAEVKSEGQAVVPGKLFGEYLRKLTNEQVTCILNEKNQLKVSYTDSEGYIQCMELLEFPAPTFIEKDKYFEISEQSLKSLVNRVIFAVATDDSRPILKGCLLEVQGDNIRAVALDGYRMAIANQKISGATGDFKVIVPAKTLSEISRMIGDSDETIRVYVTDKNLRFEMGSTVVTTRLIEGDFINYKQIIQKNFSTVVTLSSPLFGEALERASVLSRTDRNNLVKFDITEKNITITSNSEYGNIMENINAVTAGDDLLIAFNSKYFIDCLRAINDEFVKLNFTNAINPCIVLPIESEDYLYLISPVRLN